MSRKTIETVTADGLVAVLAAQPGKSLLVLCKDAEQMRVMSAATAGLPAGAWGSFCHPGPSGLDVAYLLGLGCEGFDVIVAAPGVLLETVEQADRLWRPDPCGQLVDIGGTGNHVACTAPVDHPPGEHRAPPLDVLTALGGARKGSPFDVPADTFEVATLRALREHLEDRSNARALLVCATSAGATQTLALLRDVGEMWERADGTYILQNDAVVLVRAMESRGDMRPSQIDDLHRAKAVSYGAGAPRADFDVILFTPATPPATRVVSWAGIHAIGCIVAVGALPDATIQDRRPRAGAVCGLRDARGDRTAWNETLGLGQQKADPIDARHADATILLSLVTIGVQAKVPQTERDRALAAIQPIVDEWAGMKRATADAPDLAELVVEWQSASGLGPSEGDPSEMEPDDLRRHQEAVRRAATLAVRLLREAGGAERAEAAWKLEGIAVGHEEGEEPPPVKMPVDPGSITRAEMEALLDAATVRDPFDGLSEGQLARMLAAHVEHDATTPAEIQAIGLLWHRIARFVLSLAKRAPAALPASMPPGTRCGFCDEPVADGASYVRDHEPAHDVDYHAGCWGEAKRLRETAADEAAAEPSGGHS